MTVDSPLLLALAPLIATAVGGVALLARRRRIGRARAWSPDHEARARAGGKGSAVLLALAALAAAVGISGPRGGQATVSARSQALSVVFAMDISRSMLAEDARPSRLGRAGREARRLVQDLSQDRLGLIAFAGRSYILSPLTLDGGAVALFLDALSPDLASQGGTGLASALGQGAELLNASREAGDRVLVVFTDGETHDSLPDVLARARQLREQGIRLVIVAEGGTRPVTIPLRDSTGKITGYKTDDEGKPVETARRDDVLQRVADAAEGALVPAELPDQAGAVHELLTAFARAPIAATMTHDLVPLVWVPALLAALLLGLHTATRRTAALVGLAAVCVGTGGAAQRAAPGTSDYLGGRHREAATRFTAGLGPGSSDTAWYNAGTALLGAGSYQPARKALAHAARSLDPALRYRALYNQGVAALREAAADSTHRDSLLTQATTALREALLLEPGSARAKWNLELAERRRPPPPSGGGGSTPPPPQGGQGPQPPPPPETRLPDLSQAQAEQILNSVNREERETRVRRTGRGSNAPNAVKDW